MPFLHLPPLETEEMSPRELSLVLALMLQRHKLPPGMDQVFRELLEPMLVLLRNPEEAIAQATRLREAATRLAVNGLADGLVRPAKPSAPPPDEK